MKQRKQNMTKQTEWERLLEANSRSVQRGQYGDGLLLESLRKMFCFAEATETIECRQIYIGDHMTRWTKDGRSTVSPVKANQRQDDELDKKPSRPCENKSPVGSIPVRSQSLRLANGKRKAHTAKDILAHCTITEEDLKLWQNSFDDLLKNHAGRHVFRTFLESEIADENLKFWLACEDLKKMTKQKRAEKMAQTIYDTYINVYSPHEVNIDYKMREDIVDQLKFKTDATVFTQAQHQIYTLMHRDSYPRFLSSPLLAELTEEVTRRGTKLEHKTKSESSLRRSNIICCCCRRRRDSVVETTDAPRPTPAVESPPPPPQAMEMSRVAQADKQSLSSAESGADDDQAASGSKRSSRGQPVESAGGAHENAAP